MPLKDVDPGVLGLLLQRTEHLGGIRLQPSQMHVLERALRKHHPTNPNLAAQGVLSLPDHLFTRQFLPHLTIHETYFFRGGQQMEQLRTQVLPELKTRTYPLRVWSAGCSTGEEAYTLSILLKAEFDLSDAVVMGTDLHHDAIRKARQGKYREWSFRSTPPDLKKLAFSPAGACWVVRPGFRQHVHFGVLNLKSTPWNPEFQNPALNLRQLDLILCRNVTLYFGPESAQQVYLQFARVLAPGGTLMLGATDPHPLPETGLFPHRFPLGWLWKTTPLDEARPPVPAQALLKKREVQPLPVVSAACPPVPAVPDSHSLHGLRQHVFLHPDDPLALFQLAQAWIRQGKPTRAQPLLQHLRSVLSRNDPQDRIHGELTVQELLTATLYTLQQMKGLP